MKFIFCLLLMAATCMAMGQDANLYFTPNSAIIPLNEQAKLQDIINQYQQRKFRIALRGYADTVGTSAYNINLSKRRSESAKAYLITHGINEGDIVTEYRGEAEDHTQDQPANRRVELYLVKDREPKITNYTELMQSLQPAPQSFSVQTGKKSVITGKKGTIITIPQNAFHYRDGRPVQGDVRIELTEYYTIADFISANLTTISDGRLLISGGMVNLKVKQDTSEVFLNNDEPVQLSFPNQTPAGFQTFIGERQPDGSMNWKLQPPGTGKGSALNPDSIGVVIGRNGLEITDKATAQKKNKNMVFDGMPDGSQEVDTIVIDEADYRLKEQKVNDSTGRKTYSTLESYNLNWINCDRFWNDRSARPLQYFVEISDARIQIENVFMLFKKGNGVLMFNKQDDVYGVAAALPVNGECWILASGMRNEKFYLFYGETRIIDGGINRIVMREGTMPEFASILKKFSSD